MSDSYYLVDYKTKNKIKNIENKIATKILPAFLKSLQKELIEKDGLDVETAKEIAKVISKKVLPYSENNFSDLYFDERLGFYTISSYYPYFSFDNIYEGNFGPIYSLASLTDFLSKHPGFRIEDEDENPVDIADFRKMIEE